MTSPPSPFASTVASSWSRKHTRPSLAKRTTSPTARRFPGFTSAFQREPSRRRVNVAAIAGSCAPRPMRRPCRLAGMTFVSLTTTASPSRSSAGKSRMMRSSNGVAAPGRTTRSRRCRAEPPDAARCDPQAVGSRRDRCAYLITQLTIRSPPRKQRPSFCVSGILDSRLRGNERRTSRNSRQWAEPEIFPAVRIGRALVDEADGDPMASDRSGHPGAEMQRRAALHRSLRDRYRAKRLAHRGSRTSCAAATPHRRA